MILISAAFILSMNSLGLLPAVSTILMPLSMMASTYSPYGGGLMDGRMVRFTPNGLSVISRQRAISLRRASGVGWVSAVRMPKPPALDTAEAISARPTHIIPPWMIGYFTPSISVIAVFMYVNLLVDDRCTPGRPHNLHAAH